MRPDDPRHGSVAGYTRHHRTGTLPACDPCKAAMARYQNRRELMLMRGDKATVPARGAIRRIRALVAIGWPMPMLSERLGAATPQTIQNLSRKPPGARIKVATARKINDLYGDLCMTPGPSRISATRARNKGWIPPLGWDDIDRDPEPATRAIPCIRKGCAGGVVALGLCRTHYNAQAREKAA